MISLLKLTIYLNPALLGYEGRFTLNKATAFAETEGRSPAEPVPSTSNREKTGQDQSPGSAANEMQPYSEAWPSTSNSELPYRVAQFALGNASEQRSNSSPHSAGDWRPPRKYSCPDSFRDPRAKKRSFLSRVMSSSSSDESDDFSLR